MKNNMTNEQFKALIKKIIEIVEKSETKEEIIEALENLIK